MRAVFVSMARLQIGGVVGMSARLSGQGARAAVATRADFDTLSLIAGRTHQRHRAAMAKELREPREVAKPQREHVVFTVEHDGLPPPVWEALLGDDEVARRDLVPAARQAPRATGVLALSSSGPTAPCCGSPASATMTSL